MTSSQQFKTWLAGANFGVGTHEYAIALRQYNSAARVWHPIQRPTGSRMQSYRTRDAFNGGVGSGNRNQGGSSADGFNGFYENSEQLLAHRREELERADEKAYRERRAINNKAGHGRKYFKSPEEQESDAWEYRYGTGNGTQRVESPVRWNHS